MNVAHAVLASVTIRKLAVFTGREVVIPSNQGTRLDSKGKLVVVSTNAFPRIRERFETNSTLQLRDLMVIGSVLRRWDRRLGTEAWVGE